MCRNVVIEPTPGSEPLPVAREVKCHFIARGRSGKTGNFVPMPHEVILRDGMAVPRCGFSEEVEKYRCPISAAAFGHQAKCVFDQLRGIKVSEPLLP